MTLVLNELRGMGNDRPLLMLAAADRRISSPDRGYRATARKLFRVPQIGGAVAYFGLAEFTCGGKLIKLSDWLPGVIRRSGARGIGDFAEELHGHLERLVPAALLSTYPSGFHICGYTAGGLPDFWYLSNIGAMDSFEYRDLLSHYSSPTSHFLGRDDADTVGLDRRTGCAPEGRGMIYRNGDLRVHATVAEALDGALDALQGSPNFPRPRSPEDYAARAKFTFEVVAYCYKQLGQQQIVARPIDILVLQPPVATPFPDRGA